MNTFCTVNVLCLNFGVQKSSKQRKMSTPKLIYFNGRWYGEIVRLMLTACDIEFKEVHLTSRQQFLNLKPDLPFGQVPAVKIDGKLLVQSDAIVRHFARLYELNGRNEEERFRIDSYYEGTRDFLKSFSSLGTAYPLDKVVENTKPDVDKYLPLFDRILLNNGSNGYLVGESLTFADLGLLEVLLYVKDYYESAVFDAFPNVLEFLSKMIHEKFYEKYLKKVRTPPHTMEVINLCRDVLGH